MVQAKKKPLKPGTAAAKQLLLLLSRFLRLVLPQALLLVLLLALLLVLLLVLVLVPVHAPAPVLQRLHSQEPRSPAALPVA